MTSDEALMLEFQRGSRAAFEEHCLPAIASHCTGSSAAGLNNPARAEDLTEETFLAVIRAASRYEPPRSERIYMAVR